MDEAPNVYAYRGRRLLLKYHQRHVHVPDHQLFELVPHIPVTPATPNFPVCIIGAGMAGLYTAKIFESLGIPYQIVEANTPARIGGRLYTYRFPNSDPYDYFEVGGMRYPDTPFMTRTFDLIRNRGLNVQLIPYIMQMGRTSLFYNNTRVLRQDMLGPVDPFGVADYLANADLSGPGGVDEKVAEVLQGFRAPFAVPGIPPQTITSAMEDLFQLTNRHSMRSYMLLNPDQLMDPRDVHWCETLDKSTGWYDLALTETVIESLAFNWPSEGGDPNAGWWCIDRGSSTLPQKMFDSLSANARGEAKFNSRVTAIAIQDLNRMKVTIDTDGESEEREYSAVISTVPLPRLSLMDLKGTGIHENYAQWSAIRELRYASSTKIGIKFTVDWWENDPLSIHGGQSFTDLPLRTIVYPSYPENAEPGERSKVLIVSYCWTQDAERLGALIHPDGTVEPELIDSIFRDLAAIHDVEVDYITQFYEGEYFAWDWGGNSMAMGAFALFGPGVYDQRDIYSEMLLPAAQGKLFFAGEAASACHAWVAGALDSAWRAVDQYIAINYPDPNPNDPPHPPPPIVPFPLPVHVGPNVPLLVPVAPGPPDPPLDPPDLPLDPPDLPLDPPGLPPGPPADLPPGSPDHPPGSPDHPPGSPDHPPGSPDHPPGSPDHPPSPPDPPPPPGPPATRNPVREKFWKLWGKTEYLNENSNNKLVEYNRTLMDRQLVIALHKSGVSPDGARPYPGGNRPTRPA